MNATVDKPRRIVALEVENIKRVIAVHITPDGNVVQITGKNRQGKQQPVSEPVLTPRGWVKIGSLRQGDEVIGADGRPTKVVGVYPQTTRETYLLTTSDGASTRCGPDHLWTVTRWNERSGEKDRVTETISTAELLRRGLRRGTGRKWELPVAEPVHFEDSGIELPIEPYTLGVILGDGHIEPTGYTTITSWDEEILDAVAPPDCWREEHAIGTGFWSRPLKHLELAGKRSWEKFVPRQYLFASIEARRSLLAGLLDTDGTAASSWAQFCSTSEDLADAVVHLASSLGYVCNKRDGVTKKYRYNGILKEGRTAWVVSIKSAEAPFTLARKLAAWAPSERTRFRFIDTIVRVDDEDSVCIQVVAKDGLYVTKDFILTHNTSVLDAIWWAIEGATHIQASPIRRGENKARIRLDLGDLIITRRFSAQEDGGYTTALSVETPDGAVFRRPQELLDKLVGALSFDPLAFSRMKPRDQFDALRKFVTEVDIADIDTQINAEYAQRTNVNRDLDRARTAADLIDVSDTPPAERVDEAALVTQLQEASDHNTVLERRTGNRARAESEIRQLREAADAALASIDREVESKEQGHAKYVADLERQIAELSARITAADEQLIADRKQITDDRNSVAAARRKQADALQAQMDGAEPLPPSKDTAALAAEVTAARESNKALDAWEQQRARKAEHAREAEALQKQSEELTAAMAEKTQQKQAAIARAHLPIAGIGFGDGFITLNGVPFEQGSDAEQLEASVAIAAALNPRLRVIRIRDGSLMDPDALQRLEEFAERMDFQVWVERVDVTGDVGFVIEDGHLKQAPTQEAAA